MTGQQHEVEALAVERQAVEGVGQPAEGALDLPEDARPEGGLDAGHYPVRSARHQQLRARPAAVLPVFLELGERHGGQHVDQLALQHLVPGRTGRRRLRVARVVEVGQVRPLVRVHPVEQRRQRQDLGVGGLLLALVDVLGKLGHHGGDRALLVFLGEAAEHHRLLAVLDHPPVRVADGDRHHAGARGPRRPRGAQVEPRHPDVLHAGVASGGRLHGEGLDVQARHAHVAAPPYGLPGVVVQHAHGVEQIEERGGVRVQHLRPAVGHRPLVLGLGAGAAVARARRGVVVKVSPGATRFRDLRRRIFPTALVVVVS